MSEYWNKCDSEELRSILKQDRFKLVLVVTKDLSVYKYTSENKREISHLGLFGFSLDPERESVLYWIEDGESSYRFKEVSDYKLFVPYPHHELFGKKRKESLKEVLKNGRDKRIYFA